ncbi:cell division protein ZapE [Pseudomonas sp. ALS1131]|nr:cell division protein ZapE [Pseudomonas sp. ALS1131]TRO39904.1 cell division protein ZapE [Pseudomonas sp. ALS1131]
MAPAEAVRRHFDRELAARGFRADPAQQRAIAQLADWLGAQLAPKRRWRRPAAGFYLWGGVGRGKSFVMDCLFAAAPVVNKRRVHVHGFLQELQQRLNAYSGQPEPLARVAADLAGEARLLCFDEFHVHDIGDAILLGRLLECLLREGVALVFTSNFAPAGLCPNPLYHVRFRPFIALLQRHCQVLELDAGEDYRQHTRHDWGRFIQAPAERADSLLCRALQIVAGEGSELELNRRSFALRGRSGQGIWLDFSALFEVPSSTADYLWLCEHLACVAVSNVPPLHRLSLDVQQRVINFIDVAYDSGVVLLLASESSLEQVCADIGASDFSRTRSRLQQLSSSVENCVAC